MARRYAYIPLENDLAVFARCWLNFLSQQNQMNLALVVLAERVVVEKTKNYFKKAGKLERVAALIDQIKSEPEVARYYVRTQVVDSPLANIYPQYVQAGLIVG